MIDYLNHNINKIRYKPLFWKYIEDPELFYGFNVAIPITEHHAFEKEYCKFSIKRKYYKNNMIDRLFKKINNLQTNKYTDIMLYLKRLKVAYYKTYKLRWDYKIK